MDKQYEKDANAVNKGLTKLLEKHNLLLVAVPYIDNTGAIKAQARYVRKPESKPEAK